MTQHQQNTSTTGETTRRQATEEAKRTAAEAGRQVKETTKSVVEQASGQAKSTLESQKDEAASQLHGVAKALRQTSDRLREQDQGMIAGAGSQAADQLDKLSGYLQEQDVGDLLHDAEDFARRQPELFIGGAFTVGLLAARFLKSSAPEPNYRTRPMPSRSRPGARAGYGAERPYTTPTQPEYSYRGDRR
ncbi:MAG: hypothetical protein KC425_18285 [Anaerolineales bacterium]|nr:hypothetical protein [Anaerolineales bacterium]